MRKRRLRISIFGLGPLGLVTAVCLAKSGHQVIGIDSDTKRLKKIRQSKSPFFEPQLDEYLAETIGLGTLQVTGDVYANLASDICYIAVGTPCDDRGRINLNYVSNAAVSIGRSLKRADHNQLVVVKSTVTPGTTRNMIKATIERESKRVGGRDFGICSNPEFLREGTAIRDAECPDRIIIGSDDSIAIERLVSFYREFHGEHLSPIIRTTFENAELVKYANNAFLATKISFINTIANIAERIPYADVASVRKGIGLDSRIGSSFLDAGLGYGGSCFPKDLDALITVSRNRGYAPTLLQAAKEVNRLQPHKAVKFARDTLGSVRGKKIAILGLAFKPNTDDIRGAVSIPIIKYLLKMGAKIHTCDPAAIENAKKIFGKKIRYSLDARECLRGAELAILATEWREFQELQSQDFLSLMKTPILFDGRRIYGPEMPKLGITYQGIGLGKTPA